MDYKWKGKYLLAFGVHMHSDPTRMASPFRTKQLLEMKEFLAKCLLEIASKFNGQFSFEKCGVLIAGDFNIVFPGKQYSEIIQVFGKGTRDLYLEQHPREAHDKIGYTYDCEVNSLGMDLEDDGRIDYIFTLDEFSTDNKSYRFLPLQCTACDTLKQDRNKEFSDHWAVEASLIPKFN